MNLADPEFEYDPEDAPGFRAGTVSTRRRVGAQRTGVSLYELPPGEKVCPYHYEYAEEEWVLALGPGASVRTPDGTEPLEPMDLVFFPRGPEGAHQVRNDSDAPVRVLMFSDVVHPAVTAYVDSGKVGVYTGLEGEDLIARRADAVDYYLGEENG